MLLINLLPADRRPVERTPLPRLLTVIAGVLICGIEIAVIAFLFVVRIPEARTELEEAKSKLYELDERRKQIQELTAEGAEFQRRKQQIEKLYNDRLKWAPKLDVISDPAVLPDRIWLGLLDIEEAGAGAKRDRYLAIEGWARGENSMARITAMNKFAKRLESNEEFLRNFEGRLSDDLSFERVDLRPAADAPKDAPKKTLSFKMRTKFKKKGKNR